MVAYEHVLLVFLYSMRVVQGNIPPGMDPGGIVAGAVVGAAAATGSNGAGCEFTVGPELMLKPEPETNGAPLRTNFEIMIFGLREVKGGSFGIDVQYVHFKTVQ